MAREFLEGKDGDDAPLWLRKPRRITINIPESVFEKLITRSNREGRSLSNLASFLLEKTLSRIPHAIDGSTGQNAFNRRAE